jgi:Zn-dependent protease
MTRHSIPLGKILGIPIGLDYSWFVIFALLTWMLAGSYYPDEFKHWSPWPYWLTGAATAIMLFVSVLLHELGHSVVALHYKSPVRSITLFLFGGCPDRSGTAQRRRRVFYCDRRPARQSHLGGPLLRGATIGYQHRAAAGLAKYLAYINMALVLFNLIPGYPLDGGRVFRAIVWAVTGNLGRSTLIATNVGQFFAFLLIFAGVWQMFGGNLGGGLWIAFIGWFLDTAGNVGGLLTGHRVAEAMSKHCATIQEDLTLQQLVDEQILGGGQRSFLVNRGNQAVGLDQGSATSRMGDDTRRPGHASPGTVEIHRP